MNKKVDEEFIGIKDIYVLQCICTELKQRIEETQEILERDYHIKGEDRDVYEILTGINVWEEK